MTIGPAPKIKMLFMSVRFGIVLLTLNIDPMGGVSGANY